jgi:hypothetical protein
MSPNTPVEPDGLCAALKTWPRARPRTCSTLAESRSPSAAGRRRRGCGRWVLSLIWYTICTEGSRLTLRGCTSRWRSSRTWRRRGSTTRWPRWRATGTRPLGADASSTPAARQGTTGTRCAARRNRSSGTTSRGSRPRARRPDQLRADEPAYHHVCFL